MNEQQVYFSVILPTYNRAKMLLRAIQSVLDQTFTQFELIVIDDGSTDETKTVVTNFTDSRIKYIYQSNAERSAARNKGIQNATGKYICFLDSDDYFLPMHLEGFYQKIKELNQPVAFLYSELYNEENEIISLPEKWDIEYDNMLEFLIQIVIGPPQVCIHAEILKKHLFNEALTVGEDLNLWLRIAYEYPLIIGTNLRTLVVGKHQGRSVNIQFHNNYKDSLKSFRITLKNKSIKKNIKPFIRNMFLLACYFGMCKYYIIHRRRYSALYSIIISLLYNPKYQFKYKANIIYCLLFNYKKALELAQ